MDQRDESTWVAVELTHLGEAKVEDATLEGTLRRDLGVGLDFRIFLPSRSYKKGGKSIVIHLMQGYVFLATGLSETTYFNLESKPYVSRVMSAPTGKHRIRTLSVIPNDHIESLRQKLREQVSSDVTPGDWVLVVDGTHKSLEGRVVGLDGENAFVNVKLRSLNLIATIPVVFLEVTPESSVAEGT